MKSYEEIDADSVARAKRFQEFGWWEDTAMKLAETRVNPPIVFRDTVKVERINPPIKGLHVTAVELVLWTMVGTVFGRLLFDLIKLVVS